MSIKRIVCLFISVAMLSFAFACGGETGGGGDGGNAGSDTGRVPGGNESPQPGGNTGGSGGSGNGSSGGGSEAGGGGSGTGLTGTPIEILGSLVDGLVNTGVEMPMSLPPTEVDIELSHNTVGLTEDEFGRLLVSAAFNIAAIGTFAHQIIIMQANDTRAASEVKNLVSGPNGYDSQKWICVWPERVIVVESGEYVLLVAARADVVDAAIDVFRDMAGTIGTVVTFFEHEGGIEGEGGGFGAPGGLPITIG